MRRIFRFWWLCARTAFWGNSASANDWQWIFANPLWQSIGSAIGGALGAFISSHWREAPLMSPDTPIGVFLGGLFGFCATWLAFFLVRFLKAPPSLYYEQRDRADKLEGVAPVKPSKPKNKRIAELSERYLSDRAPIQRELLDHEADAMQAITDAQTIFKDLTSETNDLTKLVGKNSGRIKSARDADKKRRAVKTLADHLNSYSDRIVEFTGIIGGLTPVLLECTGRFIERTCLRSKEEYRALDGLAVAVAGNATSVYVSMQAAQNTIGIFSSSLLKNPLATAGTW